MEAVDRACLELCLHLREPVDVVVDLFEILNRDARLLGEVFEGSGLEPSVLDVVDVEGPVGKSEGAITVSTVASVTGARGEAGRSAQHEEASCTHTLEELPPVDAAIGGEQRHQCVPVPGTAGRCSHLSSS